MQAGVCKQWHELRSPCLGLGNPLLNLLGEPAVREALPSLRPKELGLRTVHTFDYLKHGVLLIKAKA